LLLRRRTGYFKLWVHHRRRGRYMRLRCRHCLRLWLLRRTQLVKAEKYAFAHIEFDNTFKHSMYCNTSKRRCCPL
jgi:hypothetical protein